MAVRRGYVVRAFATRKLRVVDVQAQSLMLFDFGSQNEDALGLHALLLYAIYNATNGMRHRTGTCSMSR